MGIVTIVVQLQLHVVVGPRRGQGRVRRVFLIPGLHSSCRRSWRRRGIGIRSQVSVFQALLSSQVCCVLGVSLLVCWRVNGVLIQLIRFSHGSRHDWRQRPASQAFVRCRAPRIAVVVSYRMIKWMSECRNVGVSSGDLGSWVSTDTKSCTAVYSRAQSRSGREVRD